MPRSTTYRVIQGIVLAVVVVALVRNFVFDSFIVRGDSMAPTILPGDFVFVDELAYNSHQPERGDIIVGRFRTVKAIVIKRVIALPPEWVTVTPQAVLVQDGREGTTSEVGDGKVVELPGYATNGATTTYRMDPYEYYVLGDNRAVSEDSRNFGPIDAYNIKGRVIARFRLSDFSLKYF